MRLASLDVGSIPTISTKTTPVIIPKKPAMPIQQKILVTAIIIKDGKVLMQRRTDKLKTHEGKWTTPGGFVEVNERPEYAIVREVKEELDVDIEVVAVIPAINSFPNHKDKYHMVYLAYECEIISGTPRNIDDEDDISEIGWFSVEEMSSENTIRGTLPPIQKLLEQGR